MLPLPPRTTRCDTLFPYTTLFRAEEGRGVGARRELFLTMNATALRAPDPGPETNQAAFPAAYGRLADRKLPAQVLLGDADFPHIQQRCVHLVQAIPRALGTVVSGTAHLPNLEIGRASCRERVCQYV